MSDAIKEANQVVFGVGDTVSHRFRGEGKVLAVLRKRDLNDDTRLRVMFGFGAVHEVYADQVKLVRRHQPN